MKRNIVLYNNSTGVVGVMQTLFVGEGLDVVSVPTLDDLLQLIKHENVHLILLDIELEGNGLGYGIETIEYIRRCTAIPVIVMSSQTAEVAKIMSLNVGADDYVTIYDSPLVILARVKAQLCRYTELRTQNDSFGNVYRIGELELDDKCHAVLVGGNNVRMTPIEYKILRLLMQERGKVFSINQIYEKVWQMQAIDAENIVAVHIRHVREKIERNPREPQYLKVVRGLGYKVG